MSKKLEELQDTRQICVMSQFNGKIYQKTTSYRETIQSRVFFQKTNRKD